ncbi:MAG: hypothetical protein HY898_32850 [Deltaproteobacteria bacterium]|nr:hypothetical protein [Deltaproteobacteria bacterium]
MVSRRQLMGLLGLAAVVVPAGSAWAGGGSTRRQSPPAPPPVASGSGCPIVAPLQAGSRIGAWTVEGISAVHAGAVTLTLRDPSGAGFHLDLCRRDRGMGAPAAPAHTDLFEIFLANEGDGSRPTHEDHGQAALAVAEIVRANEHAVKLEGMLTLRERLSRFPREVGRTYTPV